MKGVNDQPRLREAIFRGDLRVATLTPEFNCRIGSIGGRLELFGRSGKQGRLAKQVRALLAAANRIRSALRSQA